MSILMQEEMILEGLFFGTGILLVKGEPYRYRELTQQENVKTG
jgi:hypothetical protein